MEVKPEVLERVKSIAKEIEETVAGSLAIRSVGGTHVRNLALDLN